MLKNYFKTAFRYLAKNRFSSAINIGGLSVGMAVAILIGLWIYDEVSFDKYHRNYEHIAQVMQNQTFNGEIETWTSEAMQLGPALRNGYGDNFRHVVLSSWTGDHLLTTGTGDKKLKVAGNYMEPGVIDMLSLKMLRGGPAALDDPSSIVVAASTAKSLFGTDDPVGRALTIDSKQQVKITGVYEDLPFNSTFNNMHFIAPWQLLVKSEGYDKTLGWGNSWFLAYVQISDNASMEQVSAKIKDVKLKALKGDDNFKSAIFLHPMSRWHLYSDFKNGVSVGGRIQYVRLFAIIGFFVLILACINFMNLSTARSEKRAKEVGIRKAIGSLRGQLIGQFFSESLLIALSAFAAALLLAQALLPFFNEVSDKKMSVPWGQPLFWILSIGFSIITGLVAGSYPALYLSSFQPVKVLKGSFRAGRLASVPRKVLVVIQFTVSLVLIIGTICVFRQINFVQDRPVGYSRAGLVMVPLKIKDFTVHSDALRNDLLATGVVKELAWSESPLTDAWITNQGYSWEGKPPGFQETFNTVAVSPEFGAAAGWQIIQGRDFSKDYATDSSGFIINEAAAKYLGFKDPIGHDIKWGDNGHYKIIGVVKNMIMQSPYEPVTQTIFYIGRLSFNRANVATIRLKPEASTSAALAKIGKVFSNYDRENPFEYSFADQEYAKKFSNEQRIGKLAGFFTLLAILISCLGLFGLASFVAEQRIKEIGIRKVLGASIISVWNLLTREFLLLVALSLLIGGPVAWWVMKGWLQNYSYHAPLSWWIFAAAGLGALTITLLTVSFQAIRAALMNPVKSLRSE